MASNHVHVVSVKIRAQNSVQPRPENTDHQYYSFPYARFPSPDGGSLCAIGFYPVEESGDDADPILSCKNRAWPSGMLRLFSGWYVWSVGVLLLRWRGRWRVEIEMLLRC